MHQFFRSTFFNFETVRILGTAPFGGADVAECLDAVGQIKDNDPNSWHRAWALQAEKVEALADDAAFAGNHEEARRGYLRASNYYRASAYMWNDRPQSPDPRVLPAAERVASLFRKAIPFFDGLVYLLEIPYGDHKLPGYLFLPPVRDKLPGKMPVLINTGGADSVQEELYYIYGTSGPRLGYAVLTFEGPGQGIVLRRHRLSMRPDWEAVTSRVLDHLFEFSALHPELSLDLERVAIAGASMGGYFALRGASDPRFKACVAIDPFYDMWDFATYHLSPTFLWGWSTGWMTDAWVNRIIGFISALVFQLKWEVNVAGWFFGLETPSQTLQEMKRYTLKNGFLAGVRGPVLVSGAAHSLYFNPIYHTMSVYDGLVNVTEDQKHVWIPSAAGEGGLQAKVGAFGVSVARTFEFLDRVFGVVREKPQS
ncbi:hydrolase psoB [Aspergillus lucknowensis]|uniref:Alpha/Beta hydrolase protein n=1 Tax=Aspergillus lucknowensis TaxID=176173 RepID=A0ABR4LJF9_9EURO